MYVDIVISNIFFIWINNFFFLFSFFFFFSYSLITYTTAMVSGHCPWPPSDCYLHGSWRYTQPTWCMATAPDNPRVGTCLVNDAIHNRDDAWPVLLTPSGWYLHGSWHYTQPTWCIATALTTLGLVLTWFLTHVSQSCIQYCRSVVYVFMPSFPLHTGNLMPAACVYKDWSIVCFYQYK